MIDDTAPVVCQKQRYNAKRLIFPENLFNNRNCYFMTFDMRHEIHFNKIGAVFRFQLGEEKIDSFIVFLAVVGFDQIYDVGGEIPKIEFGDEMHNSRNNAIDARYDLEIAGIMESLDSLLNVAHFAGGDKILLPFDELVLEELGAPVELELFVDGDEVEDGGEG